ncbi:hypothetical protein QYM36_011347, partial [Artemia franciscana]
RADSGDELLLQLECDGPKVVEKERKTIVNKKKDGCTPLFIAAKRGNVEIVEYLVNTCHADVEEKGLYQVPDDQSIHKVSPLWCAAVAGRLHVVKCLVKYGANVNCVSDTGSTPVRSACFMTYYDIVKFLVESGADITIPNYNGGTCLINSVQSVPLCQYLLEKGAAVDAVDIQNKTALHYAIQEHRLDTAKLLIRFAADPFIKSRYGDDALQTACLKGATEIFEYLLNEIWYPVERIADAHELIGSTFLDEHHDLQIALRFWRSAIQIRNIPEPPVQKAVLPPNPAYGNMKEYETLEELDNMAGNLEAMRLQSLMICERILGLKHKDLIFRVMFRGAAYADALRYDICIALWRRAMELRIQRDTLLNNEAIFTAQALVRLFVDLQAHRTEALSQFQLDIREVVSLLDLIMNNLPQCQELLLARPLWKRHEECFDRLLKVISHLLYVFSQMNAVEFKRLGILSKVRLLLSMNPRTSSGDTLLHLAGNADNCIKHTSYADERLFVCFPNKKVMELLLACDADIHAVNYRGSTPLHIAAMPGNYRLEILQMLLNAGAHIDQKNLMEERPLDLIHSSPHTPHSFIFNHESLKCLAARIVSRSSLQYENIVPKHLENFIRIH